MTHSPAADSFRRRNARVLRTCNRASRMAALCILVSLAFAMRSFATGPDRSAVKLAIPLRFIENAGQWDAGVKFGIVRGMEKAAFTKEGIVFFRPARNVTRMPDVETHAVTSGDVEDRTLERMDLRFVNPNPDLRMVGIGEAAGKTNFYSGSDSTRWYSGIGAFTGIRYENVWDGIDIEYMAQDGRLAQRIIVHEGADPRKMAFAGDLQKDLTPVTTDTQSVRNALDALKPYRGEQGATDPDAVSGDTLRARPYRTFFERRKVIETEFNTWFGGNGIEDVYGFEMDEEGRMYLFMQTTSTDMPIRNGFQATNRGGMYNLDLYAACLDSDGETLLFGTYIGGSKDDWGAAFTGGTPNYNGGQLSLSTKSSAIILGNTESTDFPVTGGVVQEQRYNSNEPIRRNFATSVVRLDSLGRLDAATWLGGPTWFWGYFLETGPDGSAYIMGHGSGRQGFVTKGTVQDTIRNRSAHGDTDWFVAVLSRLSPRLDSVLAGTYFFAPDGIADTVMRYGPPTLFMLVDHAGCPVLGGYWDGAYLPLKNAWLSEGKGFLTKLTPDLSDYVFSTQLPGTPDDFIYGDPGYYVHIDRDNGIYLYGPDRYTPLPEINPLPGSYPAFRHHITKFSPNGGVPVYSTYLPWDARSGPTTVNLFETNACGELIALAWIPGTVPIPFINAEDDVLKAQFGNQLFRLDSSGYSIPYSSYWHHDDSYLSWTGRVVSGVVGPSMDYIRRDYLYSQFDINNNLVLLSEAVDNVSPLHSFQPIFGGAKDLLLVRTRVPGCEIMSCSMTMPDSLLLPDWPLVSVPDVIDVTVEARNIDPVRGATAIECMLTLPDGLVPDASTPDLRQSLGTLVLRPGEARTFTWKLRVDRSKAIGDGLWVDAVIYYRDADYPSSGAPAASPCAYYVRVRHTEPEYTCVLIAPDSLLPAPDGEANAPLPFPIHLKLANTGSVPLPIDRVGISFGEGMGAAFVPPGDRYRSGRMLLPGDTLIADWQATVSRHSDDRRIALTAEARDSSGAIRTLCAREIFVSGLDPLRCETSGVTELRYNPRLGTSDPEMLSTRVSVRHVLDTLMTDLAVTADLSACRYLALDTGIAPTQTAAQLLANITKPFAWPLRLGNAPTADASDTIRFRITAEGGRWTRECSHVVAIRITDASVACTMIAPDTIYSSEIEAGIDVAIDYALDNTGTEAVTVDRLELALDPADAGLIPLGPTTKPGANLDAGGTLAWQPRLHARVLRTSRTAVCTITAFGDADSVLSVCTRTIYLEGIDGLRCAIAAPDSVRFIRGSVRYEPDPVAIAVDLRNLLDTEETAIEAEIDLAGAPRFILADGESAVKTLAALDSHSVAGFTWLLAPLKAPTAEYQDIRIRYRSAEQGEWKECATAIVIDAWPEIAELRCTTGGHDSLFADPFYELLVPHPFEVSYAITNTGTIPLTNCQAAIVLPAGFALAGSDSIQSYGNLDPGAAGVRWWTLRTTDGSAGFGPHAIDWIWTSDAQGSVAGCSHTVQVVPGPSSGIEVTPLHLRFEAEMGGALPPAQTVKLWTGSGLAMPWAVQSDTWYIDADPVLGDHAADIAVRPNTTALGRGPHASTLEIGGSAPNTPKRIAVEYVIWRLTGTDGIRSPEAHRIGPVYPHPVPMDGEATIVLDVPPGTAVRLTLVDLLGRERAVLCEAAPSGGASVAFSPSRLHLSPGVYLLRLTSGQHTASRLVAVMR